jgi:hypothetical protein
VRLPADKVRLWSEFGAAKDFMTRIARLRGLEAASAPTNFGEASEEQAHDQGERELSLTK